VPISQGFDVSITGGAPWTQVPAPSQSSAPEHAVLAPHQVPAPAGGLVQAPVDGVHVPARWQASTAVQTTGDPPQMPLVHWSPVVQLLASLHEVPFGALGLLHAPVAGSHVPAMWHWSDAEQVTGLEPVQTPLWQTSVWVHALLSLHATPSASAGLEHWPVVGSQVPAAWHWSAGAQLTFAPAVQTPTWQVSFESHLLPSEQLVPSGKR
jgi:hypothetical protein